MSYQLKYVLTLKRNEAEHLAWEEQINVHEEVCAKCQAEKRCERRPKPYVEERKKVRRNIIIISNPKKSRPVDNDKEAA